MKWMRSQFLVWLSLLSLAGFLGFWLWQEYERARANLLTKEHLALAENVIDTQGEQLQVLLAKIDEITSGQAVQLTVTIEDSAGFTQIDSSAHGLNKNDLNVRRGGNPFCLIPAKQVAHNVFDDG